MLRCFSGRRPAAELRFRPLRAALTGGAHSVGAKLRLGDAVSAASCAPLQIPAARTARIRSGERVVHYVD